MLYRLARFVLRRTLPSVLRVVIPYFARSYTWRMLSYATLQVCEDWLLV